MDKVDTPLGDDCRMAVSVALINNNSPLPQLFFKKVWFLQKLQNCHLCLIFTPSTSNNIRSMTYLMTFSKKIERAIIACCSSAYEPSSNRSNPSYHISVRKLKQIDSKYFDCLSILIYCFLIVCSTKMIFLFEKLKQTESK